MSIQAIDRTSGEVVSQPVSPLDDQTKTKILTGDITTISQVDIAKLMIQGDKADKKLFLQKLTTTLDGPTLTPDQKVSMTKWKTDIEKSMLPVEELEAETEAQSDSLANNITENVLGKTYTTLNNSKLLDNIPDNEDGLRQFRNIFKTLDTLLLSGIQDDKLTKKDLKNAGYTKQGLMLDDKEFKAIRDVLESAQSLGTPGRALISRLADGSNDPELIASLKVKDGQKTVMSRMKSIFSPNIRGNGAITKLADNLYSTNNSNETDKVLADLSGDNGKDLSRELKSYVTEGQLHDAILMSGLDTKKIFKNVTGSELSGNNVADQEMFKRALEEQFSLLDSLSGGKNNAGLTTVLQGKTVAYGTELLKAFAASAPSNVGKKNALENIKPSKTAWETIKNAIFMGASIMVAIGTKGEIIVHAKGTDLDAQNREKSSEEKDQYWNKFKTGVVTTLQTLHIDDAAKFVGDIITGEIGTIKIDDDKQVESMLANFSARMSKYTDIKEGNYAQSTMPEIRKILEIKPQATYADVRNVLISNALFQAVKQNTGVDHSFRIGPLFTGYHGEKVGQKFTAGSTDGTAGDVERGMTKTPPLTPEQITGIGVTVKKEGDKFVYTTPTKISFGNLDNIPVTVKDGKTSFSKPQTIALEIDNAHNATTAKIIFTESKDAAPATIDAKQESLIASLEHIQIIRDMIQGKLLDHSSIEIRKKYASLQKNILNATNNGNAESLQVAIDGVKKEFNINIDTSFMGKDYQIAALNMVLGELAGDGRLRVIRLIQRDNKIPPTQLKEGSDLWRAITTMVDPNTTHLYTNAQFRELAKTPNKLITIIQRVTMQEAHQMLDASAKALEKTSGSNKSNEQYTQTQMGILGVNWERLKSVRDAYHTADKEKVFETKSRTADALGFMVNHQVIMNKSGQIQQTTFEGLSGIGPEDQIRTGVPQKLDEGDVDKNKFIEQLTQGQIDRLQPAFNNVFGKDVDVKDLLLRNDSNLTVSFSYAEYPNCTNACILMNIEYKNPNTGSIVSMITSQSGAVARVENSMFEGGLGGNTVAHELNKDTTTPDVQQNTGQVDSNVVAQHVDTNAVGQVTTGSASAVAESTNAAGDIGALL